MASSALSSASASSTFSSRVRLASVSFSQGFIARGFSFSCPSSCLIISTSGLSASSLCSCFCEGLNRLLPSVSTTSLMLTCPSSFSALGACTFSTGSSICLNNPLDWGVCVSCACGLGAGGIAGFCCAAASAQRFSAAVLPRQTLAPTPSPPPPPPVPTIFFPPAAANPFFGGTIKEDCADGGGAG